MVFGVGSFAQSALKILREDGAQVCGYLTRAYAQQPPQWEAECFSASEHPSPLPLIQRLGVDAVLPMSIDWAAQPWAGELVASGVGIFCPVGEALKLERERDLARVLAKRFGIPFPRSHWARTRAEAERIVREDPRPYVIKNPLCGPFSPIHTIVCEDPAETLAWLPRLDYRDGVFLQEYLGRAEAGHIAVVSAGEIHSLVTNQEYKRAFAGNQGVVAGAPLGGIVECDPTDRYGLAWDLLKPLEPWFRETNFHGPVQVTAVRRASRWHPIEYNVRIGVTSGAMLLRQLRHPVRLILRAARNEPLGPIEFNPLLRYGCSVTLAGYGYPYTQLNGPEFPIRVDRARSGDIWWNEVRHEVHGNGRGLLATGHRIADVIGFGSKLEMAIRQAYRGIRRIRCLSSYYRPDIGESLWPPGET